MTIKNLYSICGNINHNTIFEIYQNGRILSNKNFNCTSKKLCEMEIKQFDIVAETNTCVIYM